MRVFESNSVSFTPRGSGVQIPHRPPYFEPKNKKQRRLSVKKRREIEHKIEHRRTALETRAAPTPRAFSSDDLSYALFKLRRVPGNVNRDRPPVKNVLPKPFYLLLGVAGLKKRNPLSMRSRFNLRSSRHAKQ